MLTLLGRKPASIRLRRMRLFSGSLYESIGPLSQYVKEGHVYAIVDPVLHRFLLATPIEPNDSCRHRAIVYLDRRESVKQGSKRVKKRYVRKGMVCDGRNQWVKKFPMPRAILNAG